MVNSFDYSILSFLNIFVRRSPLCDGLTVMIAHGYLLKGGIIMMFFWRAWFMERRDEYLPEIRARLIAVIFLTHRFSRVRSRCKIGIFNAEVASHAKCQRPAERVYLSGEEGELVQHLKAFDHILGGPLHGAP